MRWHLLGVGLVASLAAACGGSPVVVSLSAPPRATSTSVAMSHVVSLPLGSRRTGTVDVTSGTQDLSVSSAPLVNESMRVTTPGVTGERPVLSAAGDGVTVVSLASAGGDSGGPAVLDIVLDPSIEWTVELDGGATSVRVDMRSGRLRGLDLTAGVTRATLLLPARPGTLVVRESGGASELAVDVPASVGKRVEVLGGASTVRLDRTVHSGVAGGTVFSDPAFSGAADRLDLRLVGGVSTVEVR